MSNGLVVNTCSREERDDVIAMIPPLAARVQVVGPDGKVAYRKVEEIADDDEVCINNEGKPVVMLRPPGRRAKGFLQPVSHQVADEVQAKGFHVTTNDLVRLTSENPEADAVFNTLMGEFSREITKLDFAVQELDRKGKPSADLTTKRIRAIKQMADTWLKRRSITEGGALDFDSPSFKALFGFIMETFRGALGDAGMRPEHIETVFAKLSKRLADGWAEEAKAKMKGA